MGPGSEARRRGGGFAYIGLLALIVLIGILLAAAGEVTRTAMRHQQESELLWTGRQYEAAIGRFVVHFRRFPHELAELTGPMAAAAEQAAPDAQGAMVFRAMRRLYRDPMTHQMDWATVPSPDGGVMGVTSSSARAPLKVAGFDDGEEDFEKAESYRDWKFVYQPRQKRKPRAPVARSAF